MPVIYLTESQLDTLHYALDVLEQDHDKESRFGRSTLRKIETLRNRLARSDAKAKGKEFADNLIDLIKTAGSH